MTALQWLARHFGYDLRPRRKVRSAGAQLAAVLARHRITTVLDVGANIGQYAKRLRAVGYAGRIVSFEPLSRAHAALRTAAADDPLWTVAPAMAIGDQDGMVDIGVSAESDMSSILPQNDLMRQISPSSALEGQEHVLLRRLDGVAGCHVGPTERVFLKIDTQGYESRVLDGAAGLLPRLCGIQLEMSLLPLYDGAVDFRAMLDRLEAAGFALHLVLPGYFERKLARQLEIDGVFMREPGPAAR